MHLPNDRVSNCAIHVERIAETVNGLRIPLVRVIGCGRGCAVALPSSALLTTVECITVIAVILSAPVLTDSCTASYTNGSSITFQWSPASSTTGVTYYLFNGSTVIASTKATTVTIPNLSAGAYYTYSLYAYTNDRNLSSGAVTCFSWTGE